MKKWRNFLVVVCVNLLNGGHRSSLIDPAKGHLASEEARICEEKQREGGGQNI